MELISVSIFLAVNYKHLDDKPKLKRRCGYIFEEQNYKTRGSLALAYPVFIQLRFVLLVFTLLYLQDYLVVQCILVNASSIALMVYLGFVKPKIDPS